MADTHWRVTVERELNEEVAGLLSASALKNVAHFDPRKEIGHVTDAGLFCAYLPQAKYQVLYYPIPDADAKEWSALSGAYAAAFCGTASEDRQRSAQKLHWVTVKCDGASIVLSEVLHECVNQDPTACATRCGKTVCRSVREPLPCKMELRMALAQITRVMEFVANDERRTQKGVNKKSLAEPDEATSSQTGEESEEEMDGGTVAVKKEQAGEESEEEMDGGTVAVKKEQTGEESEEEMDGGTVAVKKEQAGEESEEEMDGGTVAVKKEQTGEESEEEMDGGTVAVKKEQAGEESEEEMDGGTVAVKKEQAGEESEEEMDGGTVAVKKEQTGEESEEEMDGGTVAVKKEQAGEESEEEMDGGTVAVKKEQAGEESEEKMDGGMVVARLDMFGPCNDDYASAHALSEWAPPSNQRGSIVCVKRGEPVSSIETRAEKRPRLIAPPPLRPRPTAAGLRNRTGCSL